MPDDEHDPRATGITDRDRIVGGSVIGISVAVLLELWRVLLEDQEFGVVRLIVSAVFFGFGFALMEVAWTRVFRR